MWNFACERDAPDFCPPPSITGFSIGLYSDHSHHHVLCSHIYGWHSPHGHLVLLDKGKRKAWLQWLKTKNKTLFTEHELFFLFFFSHFQLYKIRPKRTRPQALLFLCMILLLIVLHTSYMIYSLASQYVMYGSQKYLVQVSPCGLELRIAGGGGLQTIWGPARVWAAVSALSGPPAVLSDSSPFFGLLSVSIRPCSHYCEGPPFARLPSAWSDAAPLVCALRVWVCAPCRSTAEAASCLRSASETSYKQHN